MKYNKLSVALSAIFALTLVSCTNEPTTPPAKERPVSKPDSVYTYNLDVNGNETLYSRTYYTYDVVKNNTAILDIYIDYRLQLKSETEMQYNERCHMTLKKEIYYYRENYNQDWKYDNGNTRKFIYDTDDKLSIIYTYNCDIDSLPADIYDYKGLCSWIDNRHLEILTYRYFWYSLDSVTEELKEKDIVSYNEYGDIEKEIIYSWLPYEEPKTEREIPDFEYDYTYDNYGNCINMAHYIGGKLQYKEYNKYEYDEDGMILVKWHCNNTGGDDTGAFNTKSVYYY